MPAILFLGANPSATTRLALDREVLEISQRLIKSAYRDDIRLIQEWAVRAEDLQEHLLRHKPSIVHFSGHGSSTGQLLVEDGAGGAAPLNRAAVSRLFHILRKSIRCVVLNACFSADQAGGIAENIDCVVGMTDAVGDATAIAFSGAFYQGLGFGESVQTAFDLACCQVDLAGLGQADVPRLMVRAGANANDVFVHQAAPRNPGYGFTTPWNEATLMVAASRVLASEPFVHLRVMGTVYAYQAQAGTAALSIGRQRRKPGLPPDEANDVVVRIPGDDARTLHISRRHLEIVRAGSHWSLIDHSRGRTTLNGASVPASEPVPLRTGDLIGLAGVLFIEFSTSDMRNNAVVMGPIKVGAGGVVMEASVGDMVTVRDD